MQNEQCNGEKMENASAQDEAVPNGVVVPEAMPTEKDNTDGVAKASGDHERQGYPAKCEIERLYRDDAYPSHRQI